MPPAPISPQDTSVEIVNPSGSGAAVLLCEHASADIPGRYADLGLSKSARHSHAAWDPGARAVALQIAQALDAPLVAGRVSRLVYDCNRPPEAASAMPERSEAFDIPGNHGLDAAQRQERIDNVYTPFCTAAQQIIAPRTGRVHATALITIHSFTPVFFGRPRAVEIGILHDSDSRLADAMLAQAPTALPHRNIARNQPYSASDGVTHSLKLHGQAHGLLPVMIEIRNDLLATPEDVATMADEMLSLLRPALHSVGCVSGGSQHA